MLAQILPAELAIIEKYILSDKKLDDALKQMVENSQMYNYLKYFHILNEKQKFTKEERLKYVEYLKTAPYQQKESLEIRDLLLSYDAAANEEKEKIIEKLNNSYLHISFEDTKPADLIAASASGANTMIEEKKEGGAVLDIVDYHTELEKLYGKTLAASNFTPEALIKAKFGKIEPENFQRILDALGDSVVYCDTSDFYSAFAKSLKKHFKEYQYLNVPERVLNCMTIQQLEKLRSSYSQLNDDYRFVEIYFKKRFSYELNPEAQKNLGTEEKRINILKMYEASCSFPKTVNQLKCTLLIEILVLGMQLTVYDEHLFMSYLKLNKDMGTSPIYQIQSGSDQSAVLSPIISTDPRSKQLKEDLIHKYVERLYSIGKKVSDLSDYIDKYILLEIWDETNMINGKKVDVKNNNAAFLERVKDKVSLELCTHNKELFKLGDDIFVDVDVKNVPSLMVKLFEINAENYYRKNMAAFRTDINLDGLIPKMEQRFNYSHPPQIRHREQFKLSSAITKHGLYVVEFIGNGKSSRAVIKIGTLSYIMNSVPSGQAFYLLDAEKNICVGENTGLFMENVYYPSAKGDEKEPGRIIVPYCDSARECQAILLHNNMAQFVNVYRFHESYSLHCGFFFYPESLLMGNKASIIVRPQLLINGKETDVRLIEKPQIMVRISNFTEDIPTTKCYDGLKLSNGQDYEVSFNVIENMKSLSVEFCGEVKLKSKRNEIQTLHAAQNFNIVTHQDDINICDFHLRLAGGKGYEIYLLGKNGEPLPDTEFEVEYFTKYFNYSIKFDYVTNKSGACLLGRLDGVIYVKVILHYVNHVIQKGWQIPSKALFVYPRKVDLLEGESYEVMTTQEDMLFLSSVNAIDNSIALMDHTGDCLQIQKREPNQIYSIVKIFNLKEGHYILRGLGEAKEQIIIRVHKGVVWDQKENFILKKYCLLHSPAKKNFLRIKTIKQEEKDANNAQYTINLESSAIKSTHVHILLFNFLNESISRLTRQLLTQELIESTEFSFQKWQNFFLSNRELSSELRYCIDRRQLPRYTGCTLEKPTLLLKQNLIGKTHTDQETLIEGTQFEQIQEQQTKVMEKQMKYEMMCQQVTSAPAYEMRDDDSRGLMMEEGDYKKRSDMMESYSGAKSKSKKSKKDSGVEGEVPKGYVMGSGSPPDINPNRISLFQDFLAVSPKTFFNLVPNENGTLVLQVEKSLLKQYSAMYVLAVTDSSVTHQIQPIYSTTETIIPKRDLSLRHAFDESKNYSEVRQAFPLFKSDVHKLDSSTKFILVDSIDIAYSILQELQIMKNGQLAGGVKDFEVLKHWERFKEEEKKNYVSKLGSHELYFFLKKHDPGIFDSLIKPFLANKLEKDFLDLYLLEESLDEYCGPSLSNYHTLTAFEKCLLVEYLMKKNKVEQAKVFAKLIMDQLPEDTEEARIAFNKIFDTVIMQNVVKQKKTEAENFLDNSKKEGEMRTQNLEMMQIEKREMNEEFMNEAACEEGFGGGRRGARGRGRGRGHHHHATNRRRGGEIEADKDDEDEDDDEEGDEEEEGGYGGGGGGGGERSDDDIGEDRPAKRAYEEMGETKEYGETGFYNMKPDSKSSFFFFDQKMWGEYAMHCVNNFGKPFLSINFVTCISSLGELIAAISLMDLPFVTGEHGFRSGEGRTTEIKAASNMMIFKKEIKETEVNLRTSLMLAQRYVQYLKKGKEDKEVEEYLVRTVYRGQSIVTNISNQSLSFDVLVQIPSGSLPVGNTACQKTHPLTLGSFATTTIEYLFYFPGPGKFAHSSPMVSLNSIVIAKGKQNMIDVGAKKTKVSHTDFKDIVANYDNNKLIEYLKVTPIEEIQGFSWNYLYWRCKNYEFWSKLVNLMKYLSRYEQHIWAYSFYHKPANPEIIKEYLETSSGLAEKAQMYYFDSSLLKVRPKEIKIRHLHYFPLVNPRVYKVATVNSVQGGINILNKNLRHAYITLLDILFQKKQWDIPEKLCLIYYLLMQERIMEATTMFSKVPPSSLPKDQSLQLQYDYFAAYLDFYTGQPKYQKAREIVGKYREYPIISWRLKFLDIEQQLAEFDGVEAESKDEIEEEEKKERLKKKPLENEPELNASILGKNLLLSYTNLPEVEIKYYIIDLEVMFSRSPFLTQQTADFSFIKPSKIEKVVLSGNSAEAMNKSAEKKIEISQEFLNKNLIIEIKSVNSGLQKIVTFFSSSLKVSIFEKYGELQVFDQVGKQASEVYIKVFAEYQSGGNVVKFYKDGYTDIRGRFDYASLNQKVLSNVKRFAILIASDTLGSVIKECKPPVIVAPSGGERMVAQGRLANYEKMFLGGKGKGGKFKEKFNQAMEEEQIGTII